MTEISGKVYIELEITCGWAPELSLKNFLEPLFENLVYGEWSVTGDATADYNCIAWSVGETSYAYWIFDIDTFYGDDDGIWEDSDLDAFYFAKKGYTPTATDHLDAKVMYYDGFHAAVRKTDCNNSMGSWIIYESKLGDNVRIAHRYNQLNGLQYGYPVRYYK